MDAFMAEINEEVTADRPHQSKPAQELEIDEEDHVADFMEVQQRLVRLCLAEARLFPGKRTRDTL